MEKSWSVAYGSLNRNRNNASLGERDDRMLSKRRSRPIVVDQREYRWSIADDGQYVTLAIQLLEANGQRLEAIIKTDVGRYWLEMPMNTRMNTQPSIWRPVTPSLVAKIIKNGLALGWTPGRKSPPLEVSLNARDELEVRNGLRGLKK